VVGSGVYFLFLRRLGYYPNPWYYYAWMGLAALCADGAIGSLGGRASPDAAGGAGGAQWPGDALRIAWAAAVAGLMLVPTWRAAQVRHTNVDQVAAGINRAVTENDLVVVNPWTHGVSFGRYYRGAAPWFTIPPIADHRTHRYDQLLTMMRSRTAMSPLLIQAEKTLREGGRVWVVGDLSWPEEPGFIRPPPAASKDPNTWRYPYQTNWKWQLGALLRTLGGELSEEPVPGRQDVHPFENCALYVARGWRPPPARPAP
jgi:hypothetical protein